MDEDAILVAGSDDPNGGSSTEYLDLSSGKLYTVFMHSMYAYV